LNGSGAIDLIRITLSTSFTRPTTFGRRHHSPPYSIIYASPWGLHPNVTFPRYSQVGVPKLGLLLSQNFRRSYLSQIKSVWKYEGTILCPSKRSFQRCIARRNQSSFEPYFQGVCGQESNSRFEYCPFFFNHNSCKSSLNEQCEGTLSIYVSKPLYGVLRA
jgi:hypothetical protein